MVKQIRYLSCNRLVQIEQYARIRVRAWGKRSMASKLSFKSYGLNIYISFVLAFSLSANADFGGSVVSIADGDTITVLVERKQIKVRLVEIDAPEKAQAFGARSKHSLSDMCFGKAALIKEKSKDRYGRTLGRVFCDGIDVNAEQVRRGMAWVYDKYVTDHSLYPLQDEARTARRGLWYDPDPMPPWNWRRVN